MAREKETLLIKVAKLESHLESETEAMDHIKEVHDLTTRIDDMVGEMLSYCKSMNDSNRLGEKDGGALKRDQQARLDEKEKQVNALKSKLKWAEKEKDTLKSQLKESEAKMLAMQNDFNRHEKQMINEKKAYKAKVAEVVNLLASKVQEPEEEKLAMEAQLNAKSQSDSEMLQTELAEKTQRSSKLSSLK